MFRHGESLKRKLLRVLPLSNSESGHRYRLFGLFLGVSGVLWRLQIIIYDRRMIPIDLSMDVWHATRVCLMSWLHVK